MIDTVRLHGYIKPVNGVAQFPTPQACPDCFLSRFFASFLLPAELGPTRAYLLHDISGHSNLKGWAISEYFL
jgi:hypothetical protein